MWNELGQRIYKKVERVIMIEVYIQRNELSTMMYMILERVILSEI